MQRRRFNRHRADCIVGTVVAASFIDRQKLNELETTLSRPSDELTQRGDIANAEIVLSAQGEERHQHSRDSLVRG